MRKQQIEADIMEWNEELEKKLKRRGEIWHAEKLASRLIFDGRHAAILERLAHDEEEKKETEPENQ